MSSRPGQAGTGRHTEATCGARMADRAGLNATTQALEKGKMNNGTSGYAAQPTRAQARNARARRRRAKGRAGMREGNDHAGDQNE